MRARQAAKAATRHRRDGDSERWPEVSLVDLRSRQARLNRPFGAAPWKPRDDDNRRIADRLVKIRDKEREMAKKQWREWRGLNSRQYAYRLKTSGFLFADQRKLDKEDFERVERILVRMRRAGLLDWRDVLDGRGIEGVSDAYRDNSERIEQLAEWAEEMPHDRMEGQLVVPELWVETEGLYNLIYDLAEKYGARRRALQGQSAVAPRYWLAERVAERWKQGISTCVLGVVDYDKHGDDILNTVAADAAEHLRDMQLAVDKQRILRVIMVALTKWQITKYKIPLVEKEGRLVQEAEALPTDVLRKEVEAALRATLDMEKFNDIADEKQDEIDTLVQKIRRLRC
jgi:hypothetical protein